MATPAITAPPTVSSDDAIPLATTFTGASGCASNHLTMVGILQDEVWLNEPFPASGLTSTDCYPTEVLASLAAASTTVLPAFSPLICPEWYSTVTHWSENYIACCPSSYSLHLNGNNGANPARTAYNATCYSTLTLSTTVTAYDSVSITSTQGYLDPTAQAFAHAIDGYAPQTARGAPLTVAPGPGPTLTPSSGDVVSQTPFSADFTSSQNSNTAASDSGSSGSMPSAAVAGIVVGGFVFCLLLTLLAWIIFLLHRRRQSDNPYGQGFSRGSLRPFSRSTWSAPSMSQRTAHSEVAGGPSSARSPRSRHSPRAARSRVDTSTHKEAAFGDDAASSVADLRLISPTRTYGSRSPTSPSGASIRPPPPRFSTVVAQSRQYSRQPAEMGAGVERHELADQGAPWMQGRQKEQTRPSRALAELPGDKRWR